MLLLQLQCDTQTQLGVLVSHRNLFSAFVTAFRFVRRQVVHLMLWLLCLLTML